LYNILNIFLNDTLETYELLYSVVQFVKVFL